MKVERKTLRQPCTLEGRGLHSGIPVSLTIHPAEDGINFRLNGDKIKACPANVTDTQRCTSLGTINTIEHLMSAFCGLEITDAEVEVNAPELPGLDGSAQPYVNALVEVGFEQLDSHEAPDVYRRIFFEEGPISLAIGKGTGGWKFEFDTGDRWPGFQVWKCDDVVESYNSEIAPSRTIAFTEEIPLLLKAGLGKGLDLDSVLILGNESYENRPRFTDEPVRHKLLDLLGDIYLAGIPARHLAVVAARSGHRANVRAAAMLLESLS